MAFTCPAHRLLAALTATFSCTTLEAAVVADAGNFQCKAGDARMCLLAESDFSTEGEGLSLLHRSAKAVPSANDSELASAGKKTETAPLVTQVAPAITETGDKANVAPAITKAQTGNEANIAPAATKATPAITEIGDNAKVAPALTEAQTGNEANIAPAVTKATPAITETGDNAKVAPALTEAQTGDTASIAPAVTKAAPAITQAQTASTGTEALIEVANTEETKSKAEEKSIVTPKDMHETQEPHLQPNPQQLYSMPSSAHARLPAKWNNLVNKNYKKQIREGYVSVVVICVICVVLTFIVKMFSWLGSVKPANLLDHEWHQAEISLREHRASG